MRGRLLVIAIVLVALAAVGWAWWLRSGRIDTGARPSILYPQAEGR